jgi:hypothetical protein
MGGWILIEESLVLYTDLGSAGRLTDTCRREAKCARIRVRVKQVAM